MAYRSSAIACAVASSLVGCSFIAVHGPMQSAAIATDPSQIHCTDSSALPSLDATAGVLASTAAVFGGIMEETPAHSDVPDHFIAYYAGPLLALGIAYLWSASYGTDRVEHCQDTKAAVIKPAVKAVDPSKPGEVDPMFTPDQF